MQPRCRPVAQQDIKQGALAAKLHRHVIAHPGTDTLKLEPVKQRVEQREGVHHVLDKPLDRALGVGQIDADHQADALQLPQLAAADPRRQLLGRLQVGKWITDIEPFGG